MYDERLGVPLRWWALATMFLASVLLAFLVATPLWLALVVTGLVTLATVALLVGYGAARISVADGVLSAGRARIATTHLGAAIPLDAESAHRLAGRDADARDPTPYWLLSTRQPDRLVATLGAARADGVPPPRAG